MNKVNTVSEDVIRHGFAEPLTDAGDGFEWAWVAMPSSYKGWWVAVKIGCVPREVRREKWEVESGEVVQCKDWWVWLTCDAGEGEE